MVSLYRTIHEYCLTNCSGSSPACFLKQTLHNARVHASSTAVNKSHFFPGFTNWRLDASEKSMLGKRPWRPWRQTMERHNWKLANRQFSPRLGVVFVCWHSLDRHFLVTSPDWFHFFWPANHQFKQEWKVSKMGNVNIYQTSLLHTSKNGDLRHMHRCSICI